MVRLHHLIGGAATITAFILNGLLLGIIVKCSSDNIGVYKYFLFAYTLNAVYYCSAEFLLLTVSPSNLREFKLEDHEHSRLFLVIAETKKTRDYNIAVCVMLVPDPVHARASELRLS